MKALAQNTLIQNRYLIVHLIGKGGMGEVYLAVDQRLGSAIALKRTFFAGDEMLGTAFEREARILARMRHPALPKVSDHFTENEEQYLVMEHIAGDDLAKRLEIANKPFPVSWVMFWADQLLDALSYLHSHEPAIIHRDIKPQNLKLTDENYIILLDFGLSKSSTGKTHIPAQGGTGSSGSTGSVVGYTPHYAPMEQIRGIGTNARSDLYSLSATLYQLMTNMVPPDALTRADALLNGSADPLTPPHEINPEVPSNVSNVILRGMEVSQERRFASAREMQRELRQAFSRLQEVMSAQTVAFNAQNEGLGQLEQPSVAPMQQAPSFPSGQSDSFPPEPKIPVSSEPLDFDATLAFDPSVNSNPFNSGPAAGDSLNSNPARQADIKTEIFIPGSGNSLADRQASRPIPSGDLAPPENFATKFDSQSTPYSQEQDENPQATVPLFTLDDRSEPSDGSAAAGQPEFFTAQAVGGETSASAGAPAPYESVATATSGAALTGNSIAPKATAKKSSTGKAIAILGGLALFFVLVLGAAGAGYYIYSTRNNAALETEPTPSPAPTVEATAVPSPTFESAIETNANSNVAATPSPTPDFVTSEPTPAPSAPENETPTSTQGTTPKQSQTNPARTPVTRPSPPAVPKPTPKPKTNDNRGGILQ